MLVRPLDRRWLAAAAALFVLDIALHLPIEDVFDDVARRYGFFWYDALAQRVFIALGVALVAALWWSARPARRLVVRRATLAVVIAILLAKGFLLVAAIENIHYPQYALIVVALARAGLALEPSWLIAVGLGVVDEFYQFVMLPRGTPNYLDADDIVLNAIGGVLGVIAVLAWFEREPESPLIPSSTASRLVLLAVVVASIFVPVFRSPFYNTTPGGRHFHLLTWFETALVLGTLWAGVRRLAASRPAAIGQA
jgi:FtsH-binding integral membrane protein